MRELLFSIYTRIHERKKFQSIDIINMVLASHIDDRKSRNQRPTSVFYKVQSLINNVEGKLQY